MIDLYRIRAEQLMTRAIVFAEPSDTLQQAAELMAKHRIHCLLIDLKAPGRGLGIITGKDIVQLFTEMEPRELGEVVVSDVMSLPTVSVPPDLCVRDCVSLMVNSGVRRVVVVDGTEPIGLFSYTDVMDAIAGLRDV